MIQLICDSCKRERINVSQYRVSITKYDVKKESEYPKTFDISSIVLTAYPPIQPGVEYQGARDLCEECYLKVKYNFPSILFPTKGEER